MSKRNKRNFRINDISKPSLSIEKKNIVDNEYPIFCFKHLSDISLKDCKDSDFFVKFLFRLKQLSELGWKEIRISDRHGFGLEKIPTNQIKPQLPPFITPDVEFLYALRANGNNLPFLGIIENNIFRVLFIETKFGDIYKHQ